MDALPPAGVFPGENTTAEDFFRLADEYRRAAEALLEIRRRREPLSRAPYHFVAIHAIELYLNALLVFEGMKPAHLRMLQHDLHARASHKLVGTLALRTRTLAHLGALSSGREYLVSRYGVAEMRSVSQINRVHATMNEIRSKVAQRLNQQEPAALEKRTGDPAVPPHSHSIVPGGLLVTS